ncbi:hypothetical protein PHYPSEUDO_007758 [Phytophthora pseudosyringae]|uniref:Uncharacterized protein n=1 Tax=Phytophthora pseudosyringae TaxID=221518 RepID=A0A8T1VIW6_9STRA|nr:hypothetical protein PHYPSEUDO_007758 [Phytophthora pseudosyringae]
MVYSGGVRFFIQAAALGALALSSALPSVQAKKGETAAPTQCVASDGDKSFGVQAINDNSCAKGGLGCFDKHCRYCKVLDTPKSSHLKTCLSYGVVFTSTATVAVTQGPCEVSSGDVAAGISAVTDSGCVQGGLGCFNDHCRFCKVVETPQSSGFMACSRLDFSYSAPVADTLAPATAASTVPATIAPATDVPAPIVVALVTEAPTFVPDVPTAPTPAAVSTDPPSIATDAPVISTDAPVGVSTCTIVPSAGDIDVGVNIVTDLSCASRGRGCFSDVCRFCKLKTTPQSDAYMDCALVNGVASVTEEPTAAPVASTETPSVTSGETEAPDTTIPVVPNATTEAPVDVTEAPISTTATPVDVTEEPTASPATETPVSVETRAPATTCTLVASDEDARLGISVVTDPSCSLGGVGCIGELCRFCKVTTSLQSAPFVDCASLGDWSQQSETPVVDATDSPSEVPTATTEAPTDPPAATTEAPTDASDAATETPNLVETPATVTTVPDASTEPPVVTETPVISTDIPAVPGQETCGIEAADGDIAVGVRIATDATCSAGGIGCINDVCRFCKVEITPQSETFVDCSALAGFASDATAPVDATTAIPVATIPAVPVSCDLAASTGDAAVGIRIVTDATCSVGGLGCISDVCRFCKVITSIQSAEFVDCVTVDGYVPEPVAATTAPDATTTAPGSNETCTQSASEGDLAVGVDISTDATCVSGGVGCIDNVCRFCQVTATPESAAFVSCTSLPDYTPRSQAPVDATTTAPVPVVQATCDLVVSTGDAAVGISIAGDATCAAGGVGCIDSVCRFCKVTTTVQSAAYVDCTSIAGFMLVSDGSVDSTTPPTVSSTATLAPSVPAATCGLVASEGDAAVGIDITADATCQFGGVGCIDSVCRFCKLKTTEQSAAFVGCPVTSSVDEPVASTPAPSDTASSSSNLPVGAFGPVDTTSTDVPQTTPAALDTTDADTDAPTATSDSTVTGDDESNSDEGTPAPSDTTSSSSNLPVGAFGPVDTTSTDVPQTTPADSDATSADTDVPIATGDSTVTGDDEGSSNASTEAPSVAADEPTDVPDTTSGAVDSTTDLTGNGTVVETDGSAVEGSDAIDANTLTKAPAATNATGTSDDLLTEAPVTVAESPSKAPIPTIDDFDDNWDGSDEASEANSDSTYDDSDESVEGI